MTFFDAIKRPARSVDDFAVQPGTGHAWSITDEVLVLIDQQIASHQPEMGGALIATRESRIVIDFVADPREGESVSYWHSDLLRSRLGAYLDVHKDRRYAGTLHSHPSWLAEPSGQDQRAFADTLSDNRHLIDGLFPIVVNEHRAELEVVRRLGERHLVDLPHGTFAGYSAELTKLSVPEVLPAPMHVIPLRGDVTAAIEAVDAATAVGFRAGATIALPVEGRHLPAVMIDDGDRRSAYVVFGETYPLEAPTIASSRGVYKPNWKAELNSAGQLATAILADFGIEAASNVEPRTDSGRAELESRLRSHLPHGVDARYLVVGAGSVGSYAAELLVRSGVKQIVLVDFDTVELANLSRTTYVRSDIGRLKVDALKASLVAIAPDISVLALHERIQDIDLSVLDGVGVAVLAADDMAGEFWLGHHLYERGITSVSIKMFARGDAGELVVVDPVAGTPCAHCLVGDVASDRGDTNYGTGRIEAAPALGPDIVATAARGVKVALALGQKSGPLADWIRPMVANSRVYYQQSNVAGWKYLTAFHGGRPTPAFDSMWVRGDAQVGCGVCGELRLPAPASFGGPELDGLPPGVSEKQEIVFDVSRAESNPGSDE